MNHLQLLQRLHVIRDHNPELYTIKHHPWALPPPLVAGGVWTIFCRKVSKAPLV